ncbi:DUF3397 family protein [Xylanibacillus composti]|nr:DUF3397 family protein [Xylanibacillus composti]
MEWLKSIYALLSVLPFFTFFILYFIHRIIHRNQKKAIQFAMDISTFFLIACVSAMYDIVVASTVNGFALILLFLVLASALIGNAQNRLKGKVDAKRLVRVVWRLSFVLLSSSYLLLFIAGLIKFYRMG